MASPAVPLDQLLAQGAVARGAVARGSIAIGRWRSPARSDLWSLAALAGRYVELCGAGATAISTVAARLVREAQQAQEPVAWITDPKTAFFPPDVARWGVDLAALAVVRVEELGGMLRAADHLLRSGAFGLTVVDLRPHGRAPVPMASQVRLGGLAKQHDATLLMLQQGEPDGTRQREGSLASLRARAVRVRLAGEAGGLRQGARFRCVVQATKDKRQGGAGWECEQVLRGPLGVR